MDKILGFRNIIKKKIHNLFFPKVITQSFPIVIDGIIFSVQKNGGGISVTWENYLEQLANSSLASKILVIDRNRTAPRFPNLAYVNIDASSKKREDDTHPVFLSTLCSKYAAVLFISTYFTYSVNTKNLLVLYDFVPEYLGWNLELREWAEKKNAILNSSTIISISESTRNDLYKYYPSYKHQISVIYLAVTRNYTIKSRDYIENKYNIKTPYILLSGHRWPHKNHDLVFNSLKHISDRIPPFSILLTGGNPELEDHFKSKIGHVEYSVRQIDAEDMPSIYSHALVLIYPSKYEGFGLPILEAMEYECPVITCRNSSLAEVGGEACIYVSEDDPEQLASQIELICKPEIRSNYVLMGKVQAKKFSWEKSGDELCHEISKQLEIV